MDTPLRQARIRANKTLTEVAAANGMAKGTLSRLERGQYPVSPAIAERLARYFGTISEIEILYPERFVGAGRSEVAA
jgi:transcriptional regulator with XRE-family HTH domain